MFAKGTLKLCNKNEGGALGQDVPPPANFDSFEAPGSINTTSVDVNA